MAIIGAVFLAVFVMFLYSKEQLEKILFEYGEEKFAHGIVSGILKARERCV